MKKQGNSPAAPPKEDRFVTSLDRYLFGRGTHYEIYKKLGAHVCEKNGQQGVSFAVWAPNARSVRVIGAFNNWDLYAEPMSKAPDSAVYECFIPGAKPGQSYKYCIETPSGGYVYRADPYGFWAEMRPETASRIYEMRSYAWEDEDWIEERAKKEDRAISVYEVHIGSWRKDYTVAEKTGFYDYMRFAHEITDYVREMGYTHIELIGIAEHPLDASWGYQVTGYYAPTSRYGTPDEFKYLVNYLHKHGIGVILDWVPAHFPKDEQGLANFDGRAVYEHADPRQGEHPEWGTKIFNYERPEVSNFLIANALFWVEQYHVDGLRMDAVASMLYLNYARPEGAWVPNRYGGKENLGAIEMIRHLNSVMDSRNPGVMMIAEDSTDWPKVTGRPEDGGLGFTYKWNMGWMHDFLGYLKQDPLFRKYHHNEMTFSMTYAFAERYMLVLSHDEVVHLKHSMFEKTPGNDESRFASLKTAYTFMIGHPGKKLLFMGSEFGQRREWSEERELDWGILGDPRNYELREYVKRLLWLYRNSPATAQRDNNPMTFEWINADDADRSIYSFIRWAPDGEGNLLFVFNFTPEEWPDYRVGVPRAGRYERVLTSWGDSGVPEAVEAAEGECDHRPFSIGFDLKGLGAAVFRF